MKAIDCILRSSSQLVRPAAALTIAGFFLAVAPAGAATVLYQATNTAIYLGLPAAQLELSKPLTGKEKVLDYKVLDWRDADYTPGSPPSYADWTVFANTSYIDGNPSEIWMRQQGQWITTTTMVSSTVVSVHMTGDNNDGVGEVLIDGISVARLNMYNWPLSQTALIIASNLSFGTHIVTVKDLGPMPNQFWTDVHTFGAAALRATNSSPKWVQPPVAGETSNVFLGWNEASGGDYYPPLQIAADDWVCTNSHPVTALRWWGSYPGWTGTAPPPNAPALFNFCIWTDIPKQPVANSFSHPGQVIWQYSSANVSWRFVGWDYDPRSGTYDACFEYYQALPQAQWFYQNPLLGTNIYWLSIAAPLQVPGPVWGWKTVPRNTNAPSPDAAVRIFNPLNPVLGSPYVSGQEINYPTNGNPWDLAFELISSSSGTAAKWAQPPDLTQTGMDVNDTASQPPFLLADDFQCTNSGPLTQITVWGSWRDDLLPENNPANVQFTLSIHQDIPAHGTVPSQPGAMLWFRTFPPGQFQVVTQQANILEWWMDPPAGAFFPGDKICYKYTFTMAATEAFVQQGTPQEPIIYWLDVQATVIGGTSPATFGWKTSLRNWNDAAVWANAVEPPPYPGPWNALAYPPMHPKAGQPVNLAFALASTDEVTEIKWSQPPMLYTPPNTFNGWNESSVYGSTNLAADDWLCTSSRPVTDIHWWGSLLGWSDPYSPPMPDAFRFSIWTDVPQQPGMPFSHPGTVIWQAMSTNFNWVFSGWDVDPQNPTALPEACFKFDVDLDPPDWFYQEPGQHVYWISIAAIYNAGQMPAYPWGWKTRPRDTNSPAPDAAVRITSPTAPTLGSTYQAGSAIKFPAGASWDMAFELTTQPALDFGDAPDSPFPTLLKNNGARHTIIPGIQLGQNIDGESDGQPNANATGDNINPPTWPNDEDGVTFVGNMVPGQNYTIQVVASTNAYLQAWIDFTADGTWATLGDQICSNQWLVTGNNSITFPVPLNAAWGSNVFARFRFSTMTNLSFVGAAPDGEVEDYMMPIEPRPEHDLGDAPDSHNHGGGMMTAYPKGGPPGVVANYPTTFILGAPPYGPIHMLPKAVAFLGRNVSLEWNADMMADEDFVNNILPATDRPDLDGFDDGVLFPLVLPHCRPTSFQYIVTANAPFQQFYLNVWFDWNRNGNWNDILQCPDGNNAPEWAVQNQPVNLLGPGPYPYVFTNTTPQFRSWHPYITNTPVWMRITLSEQTWPPGGGTFPQGGEGPANGYYYGETEDYYLTDYKTADEFDFGDAPSPYPTLLANNGAQHQIVPGFNLGRLIDAEANGLPHPQALGDDLNNSADEDGISWTTAPVLGSNACVSVQLTGPVGGFLDAWFDFNKNGIWGDQPAERIFVSQALVSGANPGLCFPVPTNAVLGNNFARFRLTSVGGMSPSGPFRDGEVEDYQVIIKQRRPATNIVITGIVVTNLVTSTITGQVVTVQWNAEAGIVYQMRATTNLTGAPTNLFWADVGDVVIGPANTQKETNTMRLERYYRVVAPYTLP